jgi:hypothetical protein
MRAHCAPPDAASCTGGACRRPAPWGSRHGRPAGPSLTVATAALPAHHTGIAAIAAAAAAPSMVGWQRRRTPGLCACAGAARRAPPPPRPGHPCNPAAAPLVPHPAELEGLMGGMGGMGGLPFDPSNMSPDDLRQLQMMAQQMGIPGSAMAGLGGAAGMGAGMADEDDDDDDDGASGCSACRAVLRCALGGRWLGRRAAGGCVLPDAPATCIRWLRPLTLTWQRRCRHARRRARAGGVLRAGKREVRGPRAAAGELPAATPGVRAGCLLCAQTPPLPAARRWAAQPWLGAPARPAARRVGHGTGLCVIVLWPLWQCHSQRVALVSCCCASKMGTTRSVGHATRDMHQVQMRTTAGNAGWQASFLEAADASHAGRQPSPGLVPRNVT